MSERPVSRRFFLKTAATATIGALLTACGFPLLEADQGNFNPDILLEGKPLSDSDLNFIKHEITNLDQPLGFSDTEVWHNSVDLFCSTLKNISTVSTLAPRDLREASTVAWLLLKIKKDFSGKADELKKLISSEQISEYVFSHYGSKLTSEWLHDAITHPQTSEDNPINHLLTNSEFLGDYAGCYFDWFLLPSYQRNKLAELGKITEAQITEIEGVTDNDEARILRQLEDQKLSKVAQKISFSASERPFGSHNRGAITLGITEQELNNLFSGSKEWLATELHEIAHSVWVLVRLLPNSEEKLKLRNQIYEQLTNFWPTKNLETYLHPQGQLKSVSNGATLLNNVFNETSLTEYPSGFFISHLENEGQKLLNTLLSDPNTTSPLKQKLVETGNQILTQINQSERIPVTTASTGIQPIEDDQKLTRVGLPLALLDLIQNQRSEFIDLALQSNPRYPQELINVLVDGYLLVTANSLESLAGEELFSELFQAAFRKNNPEVTNQMTDNRLEKFQQLTNEILDALIQNKLARSSQSSLT